MGLVTKIRLKGSLFSALYYSTSHIIYRNLRVYIYLRSKPAENMPVSLQSLHVTVITWNVGSTKTISAKIANLVRTHAVTSETVIVGLQEVGIRRRQLKKVLQVQPSGWELVCHEHYGGMCILAYAREGLNKCIRFRNGMRVGVGIADRWPNKGAVAVEVTVGNACRLCFVSAHLAANEEQVSDRNNDWEKILKRMHTENRASRTTDSAVTVPLFHRYDHLFFFGDLNYRLAPDLQNHRSRFKWVNEKIHKKDYSALASVDQLLLEREKGHVFVNFEEAPIQFAPTYKMERNSTVYDRLRIPSYCDRVLWHSLPSRRKLITCLEYKSLFEQLGSDHRPVCATFNIMSPVLHISRPLNQKSCSGLRVTLDFHFIRVGGSSREPRFRPRVQGSSRDESSSIHTRSASFRLTRSFFTSVTDSARSDELLIEDKEVDNVMRERSASMPPRSVRKFEKWEQNDEDDDFMFDLGIGSIEVVSENVDEERIVNNQNELLHVAKHVDDEPQRMNSTEIENSNSKRRGGMKPNVDVGPRKKSLHLLGVKEKEKVSFHRGMRMEVHGRGLFLKAERAYRVGIPLLNDGQRERFGESLPAIPLAPVQSIDELRYEHLLLVFGRTGARIGHSGVLPLAKLIEEKEKPYCFELDLTKYGSPCGKIEACVQMVISPNNLWVDSIGRVVRNGNTTSSRNYNGSRGRRECGKVKTIATHR